MANNPLFIPIVLPHDVLGDGLGSPNTIPGLGHAGFILVDGNGVATYYEYGRYTADDNADGSTVISEPNGGGLRAILLGPVQYDGSGNISQASLQSCLDKVFGLGNLYGVEDTGVVFADPHIITQTQLTTMQDSIDTLETELSVHTAPTYSAFSNNCLSFVLNTANSAFLDVSVLQHNYGVDIPSMSVPNFLAASNTGYEYYSTNSWNSPGSSSSIIPVTFATFVNPAFVEDTGLAFAKALGGGFGEAGTLASQAFGAIGTWIINQAQTIQNGVTDVYLESSNDYHITIASGDTQEPLDVTYTNSSGEDIAQLSYNADDSDTLDNYTSAGALSSTLTDYANGSSLEGYYNSASDIAAEFLFYSGLNGSGTLLSAALDFTNGSKLSFAAGTFSDLHENTASNVGSAVLNTLDGLSLGTMAFNAATSADNLTLNDGMLITLLGITHNAIAAPSATDIPEQVLLGYLSSLGGPASASALIDLNFAYLNPTGNTYTVLGSGNANSMTYTVNGAPGAQVAGTGATNILNASGNLSQDSISNIQTLYVQGSLALTSTQWTDFGQVEAGGASITFTTGGDDSLLDGQLAEGSTVSDMIATGWGGTTLTGASTPGQLLQASLFGNDTLMAGSGAGDQLIAGEGVDALIGGSGGDTFIVDNGLAAGSVLVGNGMGDVLYGGGDMSLGIISGIGTLYGNSNNVYCAVSAAEFNSFTTINLNPTGQDLGYVPTLTAATGGTYNLAGKDIQSPIIIKATASSTTTIIGDDAAGGTLSSTFYAFGDGDDTLKAGSGASDILYAPGNGNDTLVAGNGAEDVLSASGNGNDTLTVGNGAYDQLGATGIGANILTVGNGEYDILTASNGSDTLTAGSGKYDSLTVTTGGNILTAGNGAHDILTAEGGDNIMNGGSGGDTFNTYDDDNTATGGSGNDTFNILGPSDDSNDDTIDLSGTSIDGGGGVNKLVMSGQTAGGSLDISQATITDIQSIIGASTLTLTGSELSELTSTSAPLIYAAAAGSYSLAALPGDITLEDLFSTGGVTLIGNNAANEELVTTQPNDTIISGTGANDEIYVAGTNSTGTANGNAAVLLAEGTDTTNAYGSDDTIYLEGSNATANAYGSGTGILVINYSNDVENLRGSGENVTVDITGDTVNVSGAGASITDGGGGGNSFYFSGSFGEAKIAIGETGAQDEVYLQTGITDQNVWLQQVGKNLQIDQMGTTQSITVVDWFAGYKVQSIILSNGYQLTNTQVAALVSAMAAYQAANPSFNPTTTSTIPANATLQAAVTAAWAGSITIADTAANVAAELNSLQTLAVANQLETITFTGTGTQTLAITGAQLTGDAAALGKIAQAYSLTVSAATAAGAASAVSNSHITSLSVTDSSANVVANIAALQTLAAAGKLAAIAFTDTTAPTLSLTAKQLSADARALAKISGSYTIAVSGVLAANAATVAKNKLVTSIAVSDTAAHITDGLASLQTLASDGLLASVTLTNTGTTALTFTAAQATSDLNALSLISGNYTLTVSDTAANVVTNVAALETLASDVVLTAIKLTGTGTQPLTLTAEEAAESPNAIGLIETPFTLAVSDSAADVAANIDGLQALGTALTSITLTDGGTPTLSISATQLGADASALGKITDSYSLAVSNVIAANAASVAATADVVSLSVYDTAANVTTNLAALESLSAKLISIALSNAGTPALSITGAVLLADASALAKIITPYSLSVSNVRAANAASAAANPNVSSIKVLDSAANVAANLAALQELSTTSLTSITLTNGTTAGLSITDAQLLSDPTALSKIIGAYDETVAASVNGETLKATGTTNTFSAASASIGVSVNLALGTVTEIIGSGTYTDHVSNFQNTIGSTSADTLTAGAAGGTLTGNGGADTYVLNTSGTDVVKDTAGHLNGTSIENFSSLDQIDLTNLAFGASTKLAFVENTANTAGTLTVTDGTHTAAIRLLGNFSATGFNDASDKASGTVVTYTPPTQSQLALTEAARLGLLAEHLAGNFHDFGGWVWADLAGDFAGYGFLGNAGRAADSIHVLQVAAGGSDPVRAAAMSGHSPDLYSIANPLTWTEHCGGAL